MKIGTTVKLVGDMWYPNFKNQLGKIVGDASRSSSDGTYMIQMYNTSLRTRALESEFIIIDLSIFNDLGD